MQLFAYVGSEGGECHDERHQDLPLGTLERRELVHADHEGADGGVVREGLDVASHLLDELVQRLQLLLGGGLIGHEQFAVAAVEECPELLEEAVATVDTVGIPRLRLLYGTEEHLVHAQGVGTVLFYDHVGVDDVEHRLRHLLHSPSADVLAVFEDKLGIVVLGAPSLEGFDIEHIVGYDVHIHVDGCHVVVLLEVQRHEGVGILDAVYEVASALYHTLVDELLEGLVVLAITEVVEELVPETRVDEVTRSMLATTHVEVHVLPVLAHLVIHECLVVAGVHIAQVVGR